MTATHKLLTLLGDGIPRTMDQLKAESGMEPLEVEHALKKLREGNYARSVPTHYKVTADGLARLAGVLAREQKAAAEAAELAAKRDARAMQERKSPGRPRLSDEVRELRRVEKLKRAKARRDALRAAESNEDASLRLVQRVVPAMLVRDDIVAAAMQSRHPLQSAWGGAHA